MGLTVSDNEPGDRCAQGSILNLLLLIMLPTSQTLSFPPSVATAYGQSDLETIPHGEGRREHGVKVRVLLSKGEGETDPKCH